MSALLDRKKEEYATRRRVKLESAAARLQELIPSCGLIPMTRPQWADWLAENRAEFYRRMPTSGAARGQKNIRVHAREGLPAPVHSIQPQTATPSKPQAEWAKNLAGRTGWHGVDTTVGRRLFYLLNHCGISYFIDLEVVREGHALSYTFTGDVEQMDLGSQIKPLIVLENDLRDAAIRGVFAAEVKGEPAAGASGVCIMCCRGEKITAPLPSKIKKKTVSIEEEEEEEDEGQELVEKPEGAIWDLHHKHLDSDLCESTPGVDTDGEFLPTDPSSDSSGDEFQKPPAVGNPAAGDDAGARGPRGHRKHLYDNSYFTLLITRAAQT